MRHKKSLFLNYTTLVIEDLCALSTKYNCQWQKGTEVSFYYPCYYTTKVCSLNIRVRPRFFDQVGHETMYASSGNKHIFTKSCHRQT